MVVGGATEMVRERRAWVRRFYEGTPGSDQSIQAPWCPLPSPARAFGGGGPARCCVLGRPMQRCCVGPPCVLASLAPALAKRTRGLASWTQTATTILVDGMGGCA